MPSFDLLKHVPSPLIEESRIFGEYGRLPEAQTLLHEALELAKQLKLIEYIFETRIPIARLDSTLISELEVSHPILTQWGSRYRAGPASVNTW